MSEMQLHDLLCEVAERATPVDLRPRVARGLRRRHRRQAAAAIAGVAVIVAGGTYGALTLIGGGVASPNPPLVPSSSPTPRQHSTSSVTPRYLPPGSTLIASGPMRLPARSRPVASDHPLLSRYRLAGRRNSDTEPAGRLTLGEATDLRYHPATELHIDFVPMQALGGNVSVTRRSLRRDLLPPGLATRSVTIAGNPGLVAYDRDEHAAFRVDWLDAAGYHTIMCDRIITPEGLSGLSLSTMLRVARSLYDSRPGGSIG